MTEEAGSLAGKTALVTGAADRLGRAIGLTLARAGANVVIHYHHSADAAAQTADEARAEGVQAWVLHADLADPASAGGLFAEAVEAAGPVDILVNSASVFPANRVLDLTFADIALSIQLHAAAPLQLSQALAAQGRVGSIVNLLDSRITDYDREHASYHLGKRMLLTLTRMLALELAPRISVNGIAPGLILPPVGEDESYLKKLAYTNPLNRHGGADDITDAVLYLLKSRFVTGQVLFVDGGRHLRGCVYG